MSKVRFFWFVLLLFVICLLAVGFYVEYVEGILPCPLCVLQRFAYAGVGLMALLGLLWPYKAWGYRFFAVLALLFSSLGIALATRQVWLQHQVLDPNAPCVPGLRYLFKVFPFTRALEIALRGTTDCGQVTWQLWGFSMAEWSLICFASLAIAALVLLFWPTPRQRLFAR